MTGFVRPNPPTLEDHLDLVASPEGSILDVASGAASAGAARRPLTAASVFGRLVVEDGDGKIGREIVVVIRKKLVINNKRKFQIFFLNRIRAYWSDAGILARGQHSHPGGGNGQQGTNHFLTTIPSTITPRIRLQVTRITRTSIRLSEKLRQTAHFSLRRGVLDSSPVLVHSASLKKEKAFKALKLSIEKRDREVGRLTRYSISAFYLHLSSF